MMKQVPTFAALVFSLALAGCGASEEPDSELARATDWQVVATQTGDRPIAAIKAIRKVTDPGLKDAKDLADTPPSVIVSGVSKGDAEIVADKLRAAGMTVEIRQE